MRADEKSSMLGMGLAWSLLSSIRGGDTLDILIFRADMVERLVCIIRSHGAYCIEKRSSIEY